MLKKIGVFLALFFLFGLSLGHAQDESPLKWWNDRVFYEIFVRSFYDSNGDGIGDLQGVIQKLDYLNDGNPDTTTDLGITGIWLMPVMESPSYHGYDVTDYYRIDPDYGTNEDFKQLMDEAHKRGIAVIVDLVMNHTSREHDWFIASKDPNSEYRDWYIWTDANPNYTGPWGQTVWIPSGGDYYYAVFWEGMPDLDYHNPDVTQAMYEAADFWLTDMDVDGFRLDAIKHLIENGKIQENTNETHAWMQGFYQQIQSVKPDAFLAGEAWTATAQAVKYTEHEADIVFEFDLAQAILRSAGFGTVSSVRNAQKKVLDNYRQGQYGVFLTNHDQDRVMNVLGDVDKAKVAAALLLTNPGVPFIYYGEEIGMFGRKPDEDIRRPMQWDSTDGSAGFSTGDKLWRPPDTSYKTVNLASQSKDLGSLWSYYRDLVQLRSTHPALRRGDMTILSADAPKVYSYLRYTDDEVLLVVINMDDEPVQEFTLTLAEGPLSGTPNAALVFGRGDVSAPTINASGGFDAYAPVQWMAPHSTVIIGLS